MTENGNHSQNIYVKGEKIIGTMRDVRNKSIDTYEVTDPSKIRDWTGVFDGILSTVIITAQIAQQGYVDTSSEVTAQVNRQTLIDFLQLKPEVLKKGVTILGVEGTYEGESEDLQDLLDLAYQIQGTQAYLADKIVLTKEEYEKLISVKNIEDKEE